MAENVGWGVGAVVAGGLLALGTVPWLGPTPGTLAMLTSAVFWLMAACLAWRARPRRLLVAAPHQGLSEKPRYQHLGLTVEDASEFGRAGVFYAARVECEDGTGFTFARARTPAPVFDAARAWQRSLKLPITPGWGLGRDDLFGIDDGAGLRRPPGDIAIEGLAHSGARAAHAALLLSALALLLLVGGVLVLGNVDLSATSSLLWVGGLLLLVLLAKASATKLRVRSRGNALYFERYLLGCTLDRLELPLESVRWIRAVSAPGSGGHHLLIAGRERSWDFDCTRELCLELERRFAFEG